MTHQKSKTNKSKKGGCGVLSFIAGIIFGIVCCPCMCMIIQEEKMRNKDPKYRRKRRARQRAELKKTPDSY